MAKPKKNLQRVVLNLPPKTALMLEYFTTVAQFGRTKSDLIVEMVNDFVEKKMNTLKDSENWNLLMKSFEDKQKDKMSALLSMLDASDEESDE